MKQYIAFHFPLLFLFTLLGLAYGLTIAPGLSWANGGADGGDLITASATGGVPHPSGYPLFLVLASLFQRIPVGSLAFRTNLMSAICAILATGLLYWFLHGRVGSTLPALLGALAFGLSPLVWSQAVITEVYTLQALLVVGIICAFLSSAHKPIEYLGQGLLFGLALGNHMTTLLLAPLLLIHEITSSVSRKFMSVGLRLLGVLLGLLVYVVLPLRARTEPPVNWGNPVTLSNFFWLISGQIYQKYFLTLSALEIVRRSQGWVGLLFHQFTFLGLTLGLYGLFTKIPSMIRLIALWLFISFSLFAILYASSDSYVYLIFASISFSIWITAGAHDLVAATSKKSPWLQMALLLSLLTGIIARSLWTLPEVDASKDLRAETFGKAVLTSAPNDALVFTDEDQEAFTLWYYHYALGQRPDLSVIVEGLLQFDWYRQTLQNTYPRLDIPDKGDFITAGDIVNANPSRPACFADHRKEVKMVCETKE